MHRRIRTLQTRRMVLAGLALLACLPLALGAPARAGEIEPPTDTTAGTPTTGTPAHDGARPAAPSMEDGPRIDGAAGAAAPEMPTYEGMDDLAGVATVVGSDTLGHKLIYWAEALQRESPRARIRIRTPGSGGAIPALIDGAAQLGAMSRAPTAEELTAFEAHFGRPPLVLTVAHDAVALYVHPDNPLERVSMDHARALLGGTAPAKTWGAVGATGALAETAILRVGRAASSGTHDFVQARLLQGAPFAPLDHEEPGNRSILRTVASRPAAVGYASIAFGAEAEAAGRVKALLLEQGEAVHRPTPHAIRTGRYPLARPLYLVLHAEDDAPPPAVVHQLLLLILSARGQALAARDGFLPLTASEVLRERSKLPEPALPAGVRPTLGPGMAAYRPRTDDLSGTLRVRGSETMSHLLIHLAERFQRRHPAVTIRLRRAGSADGATSLAETAPAGETRLAAMSRPPTLAETQAISDAGLPAPTLYTIAFDAVAVVVPEDNPIAHLTLAQVEGLFGKSPSGGKEITQWGGVGLEGDWATLPVVLFGRDEASGTRAFFAAALPQKGAFQFRDTLRVQPGNRAVVHRVARMRGGVGYASIAYLDDTVRAVPLAAKPGAAIHEPSFDNARDGRYPLGRRLYLVAPQGEGKRPAPLAEAFLTFCLSRPGQEMVVHEGFGPLTAEEASTERLRLTGRVLDNTKEPSAAEMEAAREAAENGTRDGAGPGGAESRETDSTPDGPGATPGAP